MALAAVLLPLPCGGGRGHHLLVAIGGVATSVCHLVTALATTLWALWLCDSSYVAMALKMAQPRASATGAALARLARHHRPPTAASRRFPTRDRRSVQSAFVPFVVPSSPASNPPQRPDPSHTHTPAAVPSPSSPPQSQRLTFATGAPYSSPSPLTHTAKATTADAVSGANMQPAAAARWRAWSAVRRLLRLPGSRRSRIIRAVPADAQAAVGVTNAVARSSSADYGVVDAAAAAAAASPVSAAGSGSVGSRLVQWIAVNIMQRCCRSAKGLTIQIDLLRRRNLLRGIFPLVRIRFRKLAFQALSISGGAEVEIRELAIRWGSLLLRRQTFLRGPFETFGTYTLTSEDLEDSPFINRLLRQLANKLLSKMEGTWDGRNIPKLMLVTIEHVTVKDGRLCITGIAHTVLNTMTPFRIRTGVGVTSNGHVVYLRDTVVTLGVGTPWEVAVNVRLESWTLDMGDNVEIDTLVLAKNKITLVARCQLSSVEPFQVVPPQSSDRAAFSIDLARLLSKFFIRKMITPWTRR
ncbi:unnamed protein product [Vitrella brassicaformis CCMP3155]|uniref:Uncharacterized protein n=1 Tax=Vitrella brassicaformis (strain CCMP3155) TaxID=1169540 RepID=A0A0G4EGC3_VITBC|nr:unnamed protein product [Vitrella brassicaformis CCMP3155]|eukprot:CEL94518.1 unnamed protein product [Vitrella brassicaformis CCMP3155]